MSGDVQLHYFHYPNNKPPLLLLHGLTANAQNFSAIIKDGLTDHFNVYALDLRGRGQSDKPAFNYSQEDHAQDVLAFIAHVGYKKMFFMGHSYGGLLSVYMAVHHGQVVQKIILLDAVAKMNPQVVEMLGPSLERLDKHFENWDDYLAYIKKAPYLAQWDTEMEAYYRADIAADDKGGVEPIPNLANIIQVMQGNAEVNWQQTFSNVQQPTLLLYACGEYTMGMPLVYEEDAAACIGEMPNAQLQEVPGNHVTMMFGAGAKAIAQAAIDFLK